MTETEKAKRYTALNDIRTRFGGMFGDQDGIFAGHKLDEDRAKEIRKFAEKEKVTLEEFDELTLGFMHRKKWSAKHVEEQFKKVHKFFSAKLK